MGIPKFYRWISERYPCLSQVVKEYEVPTFDCLYLDMNGIIHTCSHPNDIDPNFRITEEHIFSLVFQYIEQLFRIIRPRRVFYMAIDGCAPRAKMNQQRARRFRSAKEAEAAREEALKKGNLTVDADGPPAFDSNCITPGTPFMERLHQHLQYFIASKVTSDPTWQGVRVVFSGHDVPGEGEHKIMDFIRGEKLRADYDPDTRHCMYGLDADLIMLGLATHEHHFSLLREEVKFGKKDSKKSTEDVTFHLLSLSLYREYINMEFSDLIGKLKFAYDFERLLDDWLLLGFFVGNDFMPHLPSFHINEDILPVMYAAYKQTLATLDGWITDEGVINMSRLQALLDTLSQVDTDSFEAQNMDFAQFDFPSKQGKGRGGSANGGSNVAFITGTGGSALNAPRLLPISILQHGNGSDGSGTSGDSSAEEEGEDFGGGLRNEEFRVHKGSYYVEKFHVTSDEEQRELVASLAREYVTGLQWVLLYYLRGVPSWAWFFPQHYAPFVSDIKGIADFVPRFEMGKPFMPFEQLLAVLPAASKDLLPPAYQVLMTDPHSPIIDFYPTEFESDLNGKKQDWEAVILIPFIDEKRLWAAMKPQEKFLTKEENARNRHSTPLVFTYDGSHPVSYPSPSKHFPNLVSSAKRENMDWPHTPLGSPHSLKLLPRDSSVHAPGFPTFRYLPHYYQLAKVGVTVFNMPSKSESMIISFPNTDEPRDPKALAAELLGKTVWVRYPNLIEARVVGVSTAKETFRLRSSGDVVRAKSDSAWEKKLENLQYDMLKKRGIDIGNESVLVHVNISHGKIPKYSKDGLVSFATNWSTEELLFPFNTVVKNMQVLTEKKASGPQTVANRFPPGARICYLGKSHYGSLGTVIRVVDVFRLDIEVEECSQPDVHQLIKSSDLDDGWFPESQVSRLVNLPHSLVARILGSLYVFSGSSNDPGQSKTDFGLKLRFKKQNEEVAGFSRRQADGSWLVSRQAIEDIQRYTTEFAAVFAKLAKDPNADVYFQEDLFGKAKCAESMEKIRKFIKALPCRLADRVPCGTISAPVHIVAKIQEMQESFNCRRKTVPIGKVTPELLYIPETETLVIGSAPDPDAEFRLYDRVVNVHEGCSVPWGTRGNIIGILGDSGSLDVVFDTPFLGGTTLGGRCAEGRGFRMLRNWVVDISYGSRMGSSIVLDKVSSSDIKRNQAKVAAAAAAAAATGAPAQESQKIDVGDRGGLLEIASQKMWKPDQLSVASPPEDVESGRSNLLTLLTRASSTSDTSPVAPPPSVLPTPPFALSSPKDAASSGPLSAQGEAPQAPISLLKLLQPTPVGPASSSQGRAQPQPKAAASASAPPSTSAAVPTPVTALPPPQSQSATSQEATAAEVSSASAQAPSAAPSSDVPNTVRRPAMPSGAGFKGRQAREQVNLGGSTPLTAINLQNLHKIEYDGQEHNLNEYAEMWRELMGLHSGAAASNGTSGDDKKHGGSAKPAKKAPPQQKKKASA